MADRQGLQDLLVTLLGSPNVYFQPPEDINMSYPCIRYEVDDVATKFADNKPYSHRIAYMVTFISEDPDHAVWVKLLSLTMCEFSRQYLADGLNHYVYILFY